MLCFPLCSHADYRPSINSFVVTDDVNKGDTVEVVCRITSQTGVGGALFTLVYESAEQDYIEYESVAEKDGGDSYVIVSNDNHDDSVVIDVVYQKTDTPDTEALFVVKFKCVNDVPAENLRIRTECSEVIDYNGEKLNHPNAHCRVTAVAINGEISSESDTSTETDTSTQTDTSTETDTSTQTDTSTETDTSTQTDTSTETDTSMQTDTSTETDTSTQTDTASSTETDTSTQTDTSTETDTNTQTDTSTEETDTETPAEFYRITLMSENCFLVDEDGFLLSYEMWSRHLDDYYWDDDVEYDADLNDIAVITAIPDYGYTLTDDVSITVEGDYLSIIQEVYPDDSGVVEYTIYGIKSDLAVTIAAVPDDEVIHGSDTDDTETSTGSYTVTLIGENCMYFDNYGNLLPETISSKYIEDYYIDDHDANEVVSFIAVPENGDYLYNNNTMQIEGEYEDYMILDKPGVLDVTIYGIKSDLKVTVTALPLEADTETETETDTQTDTDTDTNTNTDTDTQSDTDTDDTETPTGSYTVTLIGENCMYFDNYGNHLPESISSIYIEDYDGNEVVSFIAVPENGYHLYNNNTMQIEGEYEDYIILDKPGVLDVTIYGIKSDLKVTVTASPFEADTETDTDNQNDTDTDTNTNTDTDTQSDTEKHTDTDTDTNTNTDTDPHTDTNTNTQTDTDPHTDTNTDTNTDTETPDPERYMYGDVNMDGRVTAADALMIQRYIISLVTFKKDIQFILADVNEDGKVTAADALAILRFTVSLNSKAKTGQWYT